MTRRWIQRAIQRRGALRQSIRQKYGSRAFTEKGTIKRTYLSRAAKEPGKLGHRARLAQTLRRMH